MKCNLLRIGIVCAVLMATGVHTALACSTFCIRDARVFGRNYDWMVEDCLLTVNKAGLEKTAMVRNRPARWTSRYGSVTFNQYGHEFPTGGMNEVGLVVELMWLDEAEYPEPDDRPAVTTLQWIQYQLDNSTTVADVIGSDVRVRIASRGGVSLHYLVADANGEVATIEFLDGKLVAHTGDDLPYPVLTNSTYRASRAYASQRDAFGGARAMDPGLGSLARFARAAAGVSGFTSGGGEAAVVHAFQLLADVAQGAHTVWSIVYDIEAREIHVRTHSNPSIKRLSLAGLDFSCDAPAQVVDLATAGAGDLRSQLQDYTAKVNFDLMRSSFRQTDFLSDTPVQSIRTLSRYPSTVTCASPPGLPH